MTSNDLQKVVQALRPWRRRNDEAQWTQIIAAVAAADAAFPHALATLLVESADAGRSSSLRPVPEGVTCRAEGSLWTLEGEGLGRVDLVFETPDGDWLLFVENKLGSDYGDRQLERYINALDASAASQKGLVAVTTSTPIVGEEQVESDGRWLGSLRWSQLFSALQRLPHDDPHVSLLWRAALQLLRIEGDFGPMDADFEVVKAWSRRDEAEDLLFFLLRELATPTLDLLTETLGPGGAQLMYKGQKNIVVLWPWKNQPNVKLMVPADVGEERLRIQFYANSGDPFFAVEARYQHPKESLVGDESVAAATEFLQRRGFSVGNDGSGHYWAKVRPAEELIKGADTSHLLTEHVKQAIGELIESGVFPALASRMPDAPATDPEIQNEDE